MLDEATANVDYHTDQLVQQVIREHFKDRTVLVVAHRIRTIIESDLVLVMDHGVLREADTPHNLLQSNTLFADIVASAGPEAAAAMQEAAYSAAVKRGDVRYATTTSASATRK